MAFRERIELLIDITTTGARGAVGGLRKDLDDVDGSFNKLKAGATSVFGSLGNIAAAGVAAAGAAVVTFGTKAVDSFQKVALESGRMSDRLGVSTEEASKLIEAAGDLGIETGTLENAINRMNRSVASTPEKFDAIGAAISRNKDGTVNVVQTFKNAAEAIDRIPDAATRAKVAQDIFGKGWQGIATLISDGAAGISQAMASVEEAKIIDPGEVARAEKFRDTMDRLKGVFESFAIEAGGHIVRIINGLDEMGSAAETAFRWLTLADARQTIYDNIIAPIKTAGDEIEATFNQDASIAIEALRQSFANIDTFELVDKIQRVQSALIEMDGAVQHTGPGLTDLGFTSAMLAERQRELAEEFRKAADSMFGAADASIALDEAQEDVADAIANTTAVSQDSASTARDLDAAVDGERDSMIKAAGAARDQAAAFWEANGATISATDEIDTFNGSLLNNARNASPAAQQAIVNYIAEANRIPAQKATEILAAIRAGDIPRAQQLLNETSVTRTAAINADANTAQAERDLDAVANKRRTATITVRTVGATLQQAVAGGGMIQAMADGGAVPSMAPGGLSLGPTTLVGENGPELVRLPAGSHVYKNNETRQFAETSGRSGGDTFIINGANVNDTLAAIRTERWRERMQGLA